MWRAGIGTFKRNASLPQLVWCDPILCLAFGGGVGLIPFAPGTWGSLVGVLFAFCLSFGPWWCFAVAATLGTLLGISLCSRAAAMLGVHDHPGIVWDEIIGMIITVSAVPITLTNLFAGFLMFRLLDICKPWPISYVDKRVIGGLGIMLDDVLAGGVACALLYLGCRLWGCL